jgi:thiamine biosynthesis lipoprotein
MNKSLKRQSLTRLVIFVAVTVIMSCSGTKTGSVKHTFFRMDTVVEITLARPFVSNPDSLWQQLDSLLKDREDRFSPDGERSEIGALNRRDSSCVRISKQLGEIIARGCAYGDTTGGSFDITVLPLKRLWGLGDIDTVPRIPPDSELKETMRLVDYRRIHISSDRCEICVDSSLTVVDIGGIAKGFALRELDNFLRRAGFENYLIVAGGDIVSKGRRKDGGLWRIGIQHPREPGGLIASFAIDSGCVVTSGDYERFRMHDGRRIHHIFNPFTGTSGTANRSVTVWGMDIVEIDIFSTGLFCRKVEDILRFVEARPRLECLVVDSAGVVHVSKNWREKIQIMDMGR